MFDLEKAIADWRRRMSAAGIKDAEVLDELESHLSDDVGRQVQSGLGVEGAFDLASERIGKSEGLAIEFEKAALAKELRARKIKLWCIALVGVAYLCPFVLSIPRPWINLETAQRWLGIGALVVTFISMFSGLFLRRFLPVIPNSRMRTRIQFASVIPVFAWLIAFAFVILPRLELYFRSGHCSNAVGDLSSGYFRRPHVWIG
jgi:hypothetical protein